MPGGMPINACMGGIANVSADGSRGNYVTITDDRGNYTLYAHMSTAAVTNGQNVDVGQIIGYVGSTGDSTGNHLHLEYHKDGHNLNPLIFVECDT
jgi:murein DD-endopeptidase MepM/ murein hydrolase activator NlpD